METRWIGVASPLASGPIPPSFCAPIQNSPVGIQIIPVGAGVGVAGLKGATSGRITVAYALNGVSGEREIRVTKNALASRHSVTMRTTPTDSIDSHSRCGFERDSRGRFKSYEAAALVRTVTIDSSARVSMVIS